MRIKALLLILLSQLLLACESTQFRSFQQDQAVEPSSEGEQRLWLASEKFETALRRGEMIYTDPELDRYLQGILDRLFPEFKGVMRVHVHRAPVLNAFALANGAIYVNLGLIGTLENEAQLATVLAHEGIHFLQKHSAKQRAHVHNSNTLAIAVGMLGIPLAGNIIAANAISGYSQEHELEADTLGYQRLIRAGYARSESTRAFEALAREAKANEIKHPFFFASHPKLQTRIQNYQQLNAAHNAQSNGTVGPERYQQNIEPVREEVLQGKLQLGQYSAVIVNLEQDNAARLYPMYGGYYLGKALSLRNGPDDQARAITQLKATLKAFPNYSMPHRALGLIYLKQNNLVLAKSHLSQYLNRSPQAEDRAFIELYLQQIEQQIEQRQPKE